MVLVGKWKASEGGEGKIKSDANYVQNERKTEETAKMGEQRHLIIETGSWEQGGVDCCTPGV